MKEARRMLRRHLPVAMLEAVEDREMIRAREAKRRQVLVRAAQLRARRFGGTGNDAEQAEAIEADKARKYQRSSRELRAARVRAARRVRKRCPRRA